MKKERNFPMPFLRIYPLENIYAHIYIYVYIYIFFFSALQDVYMAFERLNNPPANFTTQKDIF